MTSEQSLPGALLRLTGFLNRPQADAALLRRAGSSLDRALFPLLIRASFSEHMTVSELADTVGRHYSTVSRQVTVLEQQGFVRRADDPLDKRHSVVQVTDKGQAEAGRIAEARDEGMAAAFADWSAGDRSDLARLVNKLVTSLEATIVKDQRKGAPE